MEETFKNLLQNLGISPDPQGIILWLSIFLGYIVGLGIFTLLGLGIRKIVYKVIIRSKNTWDDLLIKHKILYIFVWLFPLLFSIWFWSIPEAEGQTAGIIFSRLSKATLSLISFLLLTRLLTLANDVYETFEWSKARPIKGFIQIGQIFLWILGGILVYTSLVNQDPWILLSGIGAFSAILLLVFKDSILGLVASIQLSLNNMVKIGDWIEMPKYNADGSVTDINLQNVKVRNWDQTYTTIPIYSLITDSFKNWRGMDESGGRRIKRSFPIDMTSIRFLTQEEIQRLETMPLIGPWIIERQKEIEAWNLARGFLAPSKPANAPQTPGFGINTEKKLPLASRRLTNLGVFRTWLELWLKSNPLVHPDLTFLVRQLAPGPEGLSLELYFFSREQAWAKYEAFQADIFDYILAILPEFGLRVFQNPSGWDLRKMNPLER